MLRSALQLQAEQMEALRERVKFLEAELELEETERREASEHHPVAFVQLTRAGMIKGCNAAAVRLLRGATGERVDVFGVCLLQFVPPRHHAAVHKHLSECGLIHQGRRQIETEISIGSFSGKWIQVRLVTTEQIDVPGRTPRYPTAIVDMSECQASQQWLALEDKSFQRLMESIDGIVWEAEHPPKMSYVSAQVERVLGYPAEKCMREQLFWHDHVHVEDRERVMSERDAAFTRGGYHVIEYRFHSAKNGIVWLRDSFLVIRNAQGHTRMQGLTINITPLKNAELELRRLNQQVGSQSEEHKRHLDQTVQSMETFCYGIAHELRAPVRALNGFGEVILRELGNQATKSMTHHLERMIVAAEYMDRLIDDLLAYGRLHHTDLLILPVRVNLTVGRVLQARANEIERRGAVIRVEPTSERVYAHPMLLTQALENLLGNALKFVEPGKTPEVVISTKRIPGDRVRITVRDNGVGIDPAWQHKIFGVFQRAHSADEFPGTGIGLAMVKRIVDLLDGEVGVTSAPGAGSTFWIDLRAAPAIDL